jgi:hypothetical protein
LSGNDRLLREADGWTRRRLRPPLGNGRLPDFHCKSVTIAFLAPYAPKAETASECDEVPNIGTKQLLYQIVISDVSARA